MFGTMFNDIFVTREGSPNASVAVPITFGPKDKMIARTDQDAELDKPIAIQLPLMSYELTSMNYDASRKLNSLNKFTSVSTSPGKKQFMYSPVPYNLVYNLSIISKSLEEINQILEQIIPYFAPDVTVNLKVVDGTCTTIAVPIILENIDMSDRYEGPFTERRLLIYTLTFVMKAMFFGPVRNGNIIKRSEVNMLSSLEATESEISIVVTPGLTANGEPTSNSSITIPYTEINADDNYGIITEITDNT